MPSAGWRRSRAGGLDLARPKAWRRRANADNWLLAGALVVSLWCVFFPEPYLLTILVLLAGALTFLALPFSWPRRFPMFKEGKLGASAQIAVVFVAALTARSIGIYLLDWYEPFLPAIVGGLLFAGLPAAAARRADPKPSRVWVGTGIGTFLVMGLALGWTLSIQVNTLFDDSDPAVHRLRVEQKWTRYEREGGTNYWVRLTPRVEELGGGAFQVDRELYDATAVGAELCIARWDGFLGYRTITLGACDPPAS